MATASPRVHVPPTRKGRSHPPAFFALRRAARFRRATCDGHPLRHLRSRGSHVLDTWRHRQSSARLGRGSRPGSEVDTFSRACRYTDLRDLDGEARKSSLRGVRFRQRQRHTNQRQSIAIVQALPVLTTCPRMGSTSSRACAACHSSQCKQAGVADPENPPFAVVTCTSSPGPSRPYRASRGAPISPSRSVNRICLSGLRWRQRRG